MDIAILGTFVLDQIHLSDGSVVNSFGGLSYTVSIMSQLMSSHDRIFPISMIGYDAYDEFMSFLSSFHNVKTDGILPVKDSKHTRVNLFYTDAQNRYEILKNPLNTIDFNQIAPYFDMDVFLINHITGFELNRNTNSLICENARGLIYMDFHSLTLGRDENGKRYLRYPHDWQKWIRHVDVLQMNEDEALLLGQNQNIFEFGVRVIDCGVNIFNLTMGKKGSLVFYRKNEKIISKSISSFYKDLSLDVTGCGDAFAAGFIIDYYNRRDPILAAKTANRVAGFNSTISGIKNIHKLATMKINGEIWKTS